LEKKGIMIFKQLLFRLGGLVLGFLSSAKKKRNANLLGIVLLSVLPGIFITNAVKTNILYPRSDEIIADTGEYTIYIVPHTHFDPWWLDPWQVEIQRWSTNFRQALQLMDVYSSYKFVVDQAVALRYFYEHEPYWRDKIKSWIRQGRIVLVGGVSQPETNLPSESGLLHEFELAEEWYQRTFWPELVGTGMEPVIETAWQIDIFGHGVGVPAWLNLSGIKYMVYGRSSGHGLVPGRADGLYMWYAPGGQTILAYKAPHYNHDFGHDGYSSFFEQSNINSFLEGIMRFIDPPTPPTPWSPAFYPNGTQDTTRTGDIMILYGSDFSNPNPALPGYVAHWNEFMHAETGYRMVIATPRDFFRAQEAKLERGAEIPVITPQQDQNPVFPGYYTSHPEMKYWNRYFESILSTIELFSSMPSMTWGNDDSAPIRFASTANDDLETLWWKTLVSHHHDQLTGTSPQSRIWDALKVYESAVPYLQFSISRVLARYVECINWSMSSSFPSNSKIYPLLVVNPTGSEIDVPITIDWPSNATIEVSPVNPLAWDAVPIQAVPSFIGDDADLCFGPADPFLWPSTTEANAWHSQPTDPFINITGPLTSPDNVHVMGSKGSWRVGMPRFNGVENKVEMHGNNLTSWTFLAEDVPAGGYAAYWVAVKAGDATLNRTIPFVANSLNVFNQTTKYFNIIFDGKLNVTDLSTGREIFGNPRYILYKDDGDAYFYNMDSVLSNATLPTSCIVCSGPVYTSIEWNVSLNDFAGEQILGDPIVKKRVFIFNGLNYLIHDDFVNYSRNVSSSIVMEFDIPENASVRYLTPFGTVKHDEINDYYPSMSGVIAEPSNTHWGSLNFTPGILIGQQFLNGFRKTSENRLQMVLGRHLYGNSTRITEGSGVKEVFDEGPIVRNYITTIITPDDYCEKIQLARAYNTMISRYLGQALNTSSLVQNCNESMLPPRLSFWSGDPNKSIYPVAGFQSYIDENSFRLLVVKNGIPTWPLSTITYNGTIFVGATVPANLTALYNVCYENLTGIFKDGDGENLSGSWGRIIKIEATMRDDSWSLINLENTQSSLAFTIIKWKEDELASGYRSLEINMTSLQELGDGVLYVERTGNELLEQPLDWVVVLQMTTEELLTHDSNSNGLVVLSVPEPGDCGQSGHYYYRIRYVTRDGKWYTSNRISWTTPLTRAETNLGIFIATASVIGILIFIFIIARGIKRRFVAQPSGKSRMSKKSSIDKFQSLIALIYSKCFKRNITNPPQWTFIFIPPAILSLGFLIRGLELNIWDHQSFLLAYPVNSNGWPSFGVWYPDMNTLLTSYTWLSAQNTILFFVLTSISFATIPIIWGDKRIKPRHLGMFLIGLPCFLLFLGIEITIVLLIGGATSNYVSNAWFTIRNFYFPPQFTEHWKYYLICVIIEPVISLSVINILFTMIFPFLRHRKRKKGKVIMKNNISASKNENALRNTDQSTQKGVDPFKNEKGAGG